MNRFRRRLRGAIEDVVRSIGDNFCVPAHIRSDVAERFDRPHIFHKIGEFSIEVVVVSGGVDEGEPPDSALDK